MSELINFRDFGGLPTTNGSHIKIGIFYRSGSYRDLLKEDREFIQSLGIKNLFDYRENLELDKEEAQEDLCDTFHAISASAHLGIFEENNKKGRVEITEHDMLEMYRALPFKNPAYQNLFDTLQQDNPVPLLHNCTAGKDRTGVASALVQLCLGANREAVMLDYLKSMDSYESIVLNEKRRLNGQSENTLLQKLSAVIVKPAYLKMALDEILVRYETFEKYFEEEYGITKEIRQDLINKYTD